MCDYWSVTATIDCIYSASVDTPDAQGSELRSMTSVALLYEASSGINETRALQQSRGRIECNRGK
jgi:hypothetical protein